MIPPNLTPQQTQDWLSANCDRTQDGPYFRPYEQSELDLARTKHSNLSIEFADVEEQFKEEKKAMAEALKEKKQVLKNVLKSIRRKGVDEIGAIYVYKDYELQTVTEYTSQGIQINSRRMTPEERQTSITDSHMRVANG